MDGLNNYKNYIIISGAILLVYISISIYYTYSDVTYIVSDIDNKIYMVRSGRNKSQVFLKQSADTLATINSRIETLIRHLQNNYSTDNSKNYFIAKLRENYHPYVLSEAHIDPNYTTYTIDKQDMRVCLRTRDKNERIYDINLLMYVCLHEISHMANYSPDGTPIIGHNITFKTIFAFLVNEAISIGIYKYENYAQNPKEYCNILLSSSIT
jgi:hypothetical protein